MVKCQAANPHSVKLSQAEFVILSGLVQAGRAQQPQFQLYNCSPLKDGVIIFFFRWCHNLVASLVPG